MSYGYGQPQYVAYAPPAPAYGSAGRRSAPPGVHVIAILQYLSGFVTLAAAALLTWAAIAVANGTYDSTDAGIAGDWFDADAAAAVFGVVAGITALFGLIAIILGRKLQRGRQWARVIMIMLSVLSLIGLAASVAITQTLTVADLASVAYPVLCLILLNTRAARSWFRYHTW
jgi:hypothetical protein